MPPAPHGLGRNPDPVRTAAATAVFPVTRRADYRTATITSKFWWQGGAWLDQGQTGTCVGHAFAHRRADNPVPTEGIDSQYAIKLYLDASGDETLQQGTSAYAACRELMERGTISAYHWISSPAELKDTILTLGSVCIGVDWFNSMFNPVSKYSNSYLKVDPGSGLAGGHEVVINGANFNPNRGPAYYRIKNSWGRNWGYGGTCRVSVRDMHDLLFNRGGDAVIVTEVK